MLQANLHSALLVGRFLWLGCSDGCLRLVDAASGRSHMHWRAHMLPVKRCVREGRGPCWVHVCACVRAHVHVYVSVYVCCGSRRLLQCTQVSQPVRRTLGASLWAGRGEYAVMVMAVHCGAQ